MSLKSGPHTSLRTVFAIPHALFLPVVVIPRLQCVPFTVARTLFVETDGGRLLFLSCAHTVPLRRSGLRLALVILPLDRSRNGHRATRVFQGCCSFGWSSPASPALDAAISSCFPFLFPSHLAWHSLGLKPCARRLAPLCFAQILRALRVSAPPATFQISRNPGSMKSCRYPRKSTAPGLGAAASRSPGAQAKRAEKE